MLQLRLQIILLFGTLLVLFMVSELSLRVYGYINNIDFRLYAKEFKNTNRLPENILGQPINRPSEQALATTSDFSVMYSINSKGLRDKEYSYEKPDKIRRILMFGDSFTFGEGIPYGKRFSDILESNLPDTEVLNFGYPGASLDRIAFLITNEGVKYKPDSVVILLNNLVTDRGFAELTSYFESTPSSFMMYSPSKWTSDDAKTVYLKHNDPFYDYKPGFLLEHSYLCAFMYYRYSVYKLMDTLRANDKKMWEYYRVQFKLREDKYFLRNTDITKRTKQILETIRQNVLLMNSTLIVVNIDTEPLVHFYDSDMPFQYIDMSEALKNEEKKYTLTFTYDLHYNERTNAFIGAKLTELFRNNLK